MARTRSDESGWAFGTIAATAFKHIAQRGEKGRHHSGANPRVDRRSSHGSMACNSAATSGVFRGVAGRAWIFAALDERMIPFR